MAETPKPYLDEPINRVGDIGEVGPADWRFSILRPLVDDGLITSDELFHVIEVTRANDDADVLYAVAAGELNLTGRAISQALQGTQWARPPEKIDRMKKGYADWWKNLASNAKEYAKLTGPGMQYQASNMIAKAFVKAAVAGWEEIETPDFAGTPRHEAIKRDKEKVRSVIEVALAEDYITEETAGELRKAVKLWDKGSVTHGISFNAENDATIFEFLSEMETEGLDTDILSEIESTPYAEQQDVSAAVPSPEYDSRIGRYLPEDERLALEQQRPGYNQPLDFSELSMEDAMEAVGLEVNRIALMSPEELAQSGYDNYVIEDGAVWDRSVGVDTVMTKSMYNVLAQNETARAAYIAAKTPSPALQVTLDLPFFSGRGPQMPIEDIGIPSLFPTEAYEIDAYEYQSELESIAEWSSMAPRSRRMLLGIMDRGEMLEGDYNKGGYYESYKPYETMNFSDPYNVKAAEVWNFYKQESAVWQQDPISLMTVQGNRNRQQSAWMRRQAAASGSGRRSSGGGPTYSVPASLREIPDYKTLAERTKTVFNRELGRDMEDWELQLLADELKDKYTQANEQRIKIHKSAWDDAVAGGSVDVDFSEIEEPIEGLQYDIGESYKSEIDRYDRVEDRANNRRLLMDSISIGERMI